MKNVTMTLKEYNAQPDTTKVTKTDVTKAMNLIVQHGLNTSISTATVIKRTPSVVTTYRGLHNVIPVLSKFSVLETKTVKEHVTKAKNVCVYLVEGVLIDNNKRIFKVGITSSTEDRYDNLVKEYTKVAFWKTIRNKKFPLSGEAYLVEKALHTLIKAKPETELATEERNKIKGLNGYTEVFSYDEQTIAWLRLFLED